MSEVGLRAAFLRRKPIDDIESEGGGLERTLGLWQLTAIGIGGIIGAGIFSLAGAVANEKAGPAVVISFLIAGVASAAAAFSYAEFAGLIPRAGSAYTYGYVVLGEFAGWFIGWDLLLEYTAIVSVVAIGISGYFGELIGFLGLSLPQWMLGAPGSETGEVPPGTYKVDLFAVLLCLLIAFVLNRGMRSAARFETVAGLSQGRDRSDGDRRRLRSTSRRTTTSRSSRSGSAGRSPAPRRCSSPCSATTR